MASEKTQTSIHVYVSSFIADIEMFVYAQIFEETLIIKSLQINFGSLLTQSSTNYLIE